MPKRRKDDQYRPRRRERREPAPHVAVFDDQKVRLREAVVGLEHFQFHGIEYPAC